MATHSNAHSVPTLSIVSAPIHSTPAPKYPGYLAGRSPLPTPYAHITSPIMGHVGTAQYSMPQGALLSGGHPGHVAAVRSTLRPHDGTSPLAGLPPPQQMAAQQAAMMHTLQMPDAALLHAMQVQALQYQTAATQPHYMHVAPPHGPPPHQAAAAAQQQQQHAMQMQALAMQGAAVHPAMYMNMNMFPLMMPMFGAPTAPGPGAVAVAPSAPTVEPAAPPRPTVSPSSRHHATHTPYERQVRLPTATARDADTQGYQKVFASSEDATSRRPRRSRSYDEHDNPTRHVAARLPPSERHLHDTRAQDVRSCLSCKTTT